MKTTSLLRPVLVVGVFAAGLYSLIASNGTNPTTPTAQTWWTGYSHASVWGAFAVPNTSAPPPATSCTSNTPPRIEPADWWAAQPANITGGSDVVGTTLWSSTDLSCPRAMQTVYRSVMVADLSGYYARFPSGTPQVGNRISKATMQFNLIGSGPTLPVVNPLNFPCDSLAGGVGKVSVLRRGAVITQGPDTVPVDTTLQFGRLIQASPTGPFTGPSVIGAFPAAGDLAADLTLIGGPGTFQNGALEITTVGPGIHNVKIDVTNWVRGATNINLPFIGFTIASINEATISVSTPVQFDCRNWIQPVDLNVTHN